MDRTSHFGRNLLIITLMTWSFAAGWAFHHYFGGAGDGDGHGDATRLAQLGEAEAVRELVGNADVGTLRPVALFNEVLNNIRRNYYKPITDDDESLLAYGAAKGLTRALGDPYSDFMEPSVVKEFSSDTEGVLEGIGAELIEDVDEGSGARRVLVHKPLKGGPAAEAGLMPGDILLMVDEVSVLDKSVDEVAIRIRGQGGTVVALTVVREGVDEPLDFNITRARIEIPVVEWRVIDGDIGYIAADQFNDPTVPKMQEALAALEAKGVKGLIVDLRDNKGGVLDYSVEFSSLFIDEGPILWVEERTGGPKPIMADKAYYRGAPGPVAVLMNGRTASAAEIVAGAWQDAGVAALVGTRSFGKGLVQTVVPLHDPSVRLKLTTARWLTRDKRFINQDLPPVRRMLGLEPDETDEAEPGGLEPDFLVEMAEGEEARREKDRDRMLDQLPDEEDPQLQEAIKYVRGEA